eukprot:g17830.t1
MAAIPQRERVFAFRDFVVKTWDLHDAHWTGRTVLDVAGGKGDLSWLLANADALDSVVVDPRCTDHTKITRTAKWHFEPLGELLEHRRKPFVEWKFFWEEASKRAEQTERCGHHQSLELENSQGAGAPRAVRIEEAAEALEAIHSCSLILGFHPDQATEACIDLALELQRPFAVCPCCVFPKDFPERKLYGRTVKTYPDAQPLQRYLGLFWLALVWSFGATTDTAGRKIMDKLRAQKRSIPGVEVMVPTTDTVRSAFLLQTMVASENHVLYSGLTGTGKTVVIQQELLKRFDKEKYSVISFAFSAQTNANQTQELGQRAEPSR